MPPPLCTCGSNSRGALLLSKTGIGLLVVVKQQMKQRGPFLSAVTGACVARLSHLSCLFRFAVLSVHPRYLSCLVSPPRLLAVARFPRQGLRRGSLEFFAHGGVGVDGSVLLWISSSQKIFAHNTAINTAIIGPSIKALVMLSRFFAIRSNSASLHAAMVSWCGGGRMKSVGVMELWER